MPDITLSEPTEEQVLNKVWAAVGEFSDRPEVRRMNLGGLTFTGGSKIDHRSFRLEFEDESRNRLDFVVYVVKSGSIYTPVEGT